MNPSKPIREANGYVLNVAAARRQVLLRAHRSARIVAEPVPDFTHPRSHSLVCFVGFEDGVITHLALGRRGQRAGTERRRLNLRDLVKLSESVSHAAVLDKIPKRFQPPVQRCLADDGLLPPGSFVAVVDAVRDLVPESIQILERFSAKRRAELADLTAETGRGLAYQKETVATALTLTGIETTQLQVLATIRTSSAGAVLLDGCRAGTDPSEGRRPSS